jgi:hypothetical protein
MPVLKASSMPPSSSNNATPKQLTCASTGHVTTLLPKASSPYTGNLVPPIWLRTTIHYTSNTMRPSSPPASMSALSICMRVHTGSTSHPDDTHEEHRCAPRSAVRGGVSNFHVIPYTTETKYRPASHQQLPSSIGLSHMENQDVRRANSQ